MGRGVGAEGCDNVVAPVDEHLRGREPEVLVEACACALHDVDEEPCDVSAVVGLLLDDVGELLGGGIHGGAHGAGG